MKRYEEIAKRIENKVDVVGAEIGVQRGKTADYLMRLPQVKRYWCIDPWEYIPEYAAVVAYKNVGPRMTCRLFSQFLSHALDYPHKVRIITAPSVIAAKVIEDQSLDFVFIDATHNFKCVNEDITAWLPKVKHGGFIGGHDYNDDRFPGVKQAVEGWNFPTLEVGNDHTWFAPVGVQYNINVNRLHSLPNRVH